MSSNDSSRESGSWSSGDGDVRRQQRLGRGSVQVQRVDRDAAAAGHDREALHRVVDRAQHRLRGTAAERVVGAGHDHRQVLAAQGGQRPWHDAPRAAPDDRERARLPVTLGRRRAA